MTHMQLTTSSTSFGTKRRKNPTERYGSSILLFLESVFHASHQRSKWNTLLNDDPLIVGSHVNDILQVKPRKVEAEVSRGKVHMSQEKIGLKKCFSTLAILHTHDEQHRCQTSPSTPLLLAALPMTFLVSFLFSRFLNFLHV